MADDIESFEQQLLAAYRAEVAPSEAFRKTVYRRVRHGTVIPPSRWRSPWLAAAVVLLAVAGVVAWGLGPRLLRPDDPAVRDQAVRQAVPKAGARTENGVAAPQDPSVRGRGPGDAPPDAPALLPPQTMPEPTPEPSSAPSSALGSIPSAAPDPHPGPGRRRAPKPTAVAPPTPGPDPLAAETEAIRQIQLALAAGRTADALRLIVAYRSRHPSGALAIEADALDVIARCKRGDAGGAGRARGFLGRHPRSAFAGRIRAACPVSGGSRGVADSGNRDPG